MKNVLKNPVNPLIMSSVVLAIVLVCCTSADTPELPTIDGTSSSGDDISPSQNPDPPAQAPTSSSSSTPSSSSSSSSSACVNPSSYSTFRTALIGSQTWMAENLNYAACGSKCYNNDPANCAKYGRLYDWAIAMNLPSSCNSSTCSSQIQSKHRGICPAGWHLPSDDEWDALMNSVGGKSTAGKHLKATSGWNDWYENGNGLDTDGFAALPGGYGDSGGNFHSVVSGGYWWSASEYNSYDAYGGNMSYAGDGIGWRDRSKLELYSIRCLQD
jgi:uncharacterized protein (TIGR02145 family)